MFEEYDFAGVYIAIQAVLTLYAQGRLTDTHILSHPPPYGTLGFGMHGQECNQGEVEQEDWEGRCCGLPHDSSTFA